MDIESEIGSLWRSRYTLIWVVTPEEVRTSELIKKCTEISTKKPKTCYCWSITKGLYKYGQEEAEPCDPLVVLNMFLDKKDASGVDHEPSVLILYDYHAFLEGNAPIVRRLKEVSEEIKKSPKNIVILSPFNKVPVELQGYIHVIDIPYPTKEELAEVVKSCYRTKPEFSKITGERNKEEIINEISSAATGLTKNELVLILAQIIDKEKYDLEYVIQAKKQQIKKSGVLEYFDVQEFNVSDIGGLKNLKNEIRKIKKLFSPEAEKYGLEKPKGMIFIGPPGTGKSLSAKVIAAILKVPLIRISMASIASKWYGESTANLKNALNLITALSPCVVLLDEIEKLLSTGASGEMHEETARMIGEFLTFMEENKSPILWVGTCNDFRTLKPELQQRFESMYFVDLPQRSEREEIFKIHMLKFKINPEKFNLKELSELSAGYVGREIRVIVKEAISSAFVEDRPLSQQDIIREIKKRVPTSKQREKESGGISEMRVWAKNNCIPASEPEITESKPKTDELKNKEETFTEE